MTRDDPGTLPAQTRADFADRLGPEGGTRPAPARTRENKKRATARNHAGAHRR